MMNRSKARRIFILGLILVVCGAGWLSVQYGKRASVLRRAERACVVGDWVVAARSLEPYLARYPEDWKAHLLMARARFGGGQLQAGLEHLRTIPQDSSLYIEAKFYEGAALLDMDRGARAEQVLLECLTLDSENVPARQKLVELYLLEDRRPEARQLVWEVCDRVAANRRVFALERLFHVDYGGYAPPVRKERLERFIAQNPRNFDAVSALAALYASADDSNLRAQATTLLQPALNEQPAHVGCRATLAEIAIGDDPEQVMQLVDGWPVDQRDEQYLTLRGTIAQDHERDFAAAAENFRRVLQTQPDNWRVRARLAACLRVLGQAEQADYQLNRQSRVSEVLQAENITRFLQDLTTQLDTAAFRHRVGRLYETVGRFKEARSWYEEALRVQRAHRPSQEGLERLETKPDVEPVDGTDDRQGEPAAKSASSTDRPQVARLTNGSPRLQGLGSLIDVAFARIGRQNGNVILLGPTNPNG